MINTCRHSWLSSWIVVDDVRWVRPSSSTDTDPYSEIFVRPVEFKNNINEKNPMISREFSNELLVRLIYESSVSCVSLWRSRVGPDACVPTHNWIIKGQEKSWNFLNFFGGNPPQHTACVRRVWNSHRALASIVPPNSTYHALPTHTQVWGWSLMLFCTHKFSKSLLYPNFFWNFNAIVWMHKVGIYNLRKVCLYFTF